MAENQLSVTDSKITAIGSTFQVAYNGPEVSNGSMDARELAIALAGLGELMERSNLLLNGEGSVVKLRVLAEFESGSFDVNFTLDQSLRDAAVALLPALSALTAKQILDITLGTYEKVKGIVSGAAKIYKAVRGEKPSDTKPGEQINTRILVFGNNNTIVTDVNSARLYNDERVRAALSKSAEPLLRAGYETLSVSRDGQVIETLESADVQALPTPEETSMIDSTTPSPTRELWVRVVKPNFDGGRWTFHDGSAKFGADVEDKGFQARVNSREQGFFQEDTFLIKLRSNQHLDKNGGLVTTNVVEEVLDQREGPRQRRLTTPDRNDGQNT